MKAEEIKVGMLVWWDKSPHPGIVIQFDVDAHGFAISTFDHCVVCGYSLLNNLRPASLEEVRNYFHTQEMKEKNRIAALSRQIEESKAQIAQYQAKFAELSKLPPQ